LTWVRRDDQASIHRKVAPLDDGCYRLWSEAIEWCSRNGTDGRIAPDELAEIKRGTPARATVLVGRELWHVAGYVCDSDKCPPSGVDGWVIHDYLDYNPSKAQVRAELAAKAERTRRWRERRARDPGGDASRDGSRNGHRDVSDASRDGPVMLPRPVPPRPEGRRGVDAPQQPPAADGGEAPAGGWREDQKPRVAHGPPDLADLREHLAGAARKQRPPGRRPGAFDELRDATPDVAALVEPDPPAAEPEELSPA
jgi:hypothetical protein